jgi:hypothetical protein
MTKGQMTTGLQKAVKMDAVPPEKFGAIVRRTFLGTLLIGVGVAGMAAWGMNHYLAVGLVMLGATTWSSQLVTQSVKALVEPITAIKRALDSTGPTSRDS